MLNFSVRNLLRAKKEHRPDRPMSAERRIAFGVDHRTKRVQKSLFGFLFAEEIAKQDLPLDILPPNQRDDLFRYGVFGMNRTTLEQRRWLQRWIQGGGLERLAGLGPLGD